MKAHFLFLFALSILAPGILSDMILTDDQKALFGIPTSNSNTPNDASLSGISEEKYRWPNGVVPYTLTGFSYAERRKILETISTLNDQLEGCINIRPYSSNTDVDYINIFKGEPRKCWSKVGRIGGHQPLSLGDRCIERGTITHELLHALGLYHEHQRSDRDNYVEIHRDNMVDLTDSKYKTNFAKCTGCKDYGIPYNIESVMHYPQWGFAKPNSQSITAHDSTKQSRMGASTGLGMYDKALLLAMYKCVNPHCPLGCPASEVFFNCRPAGRGRSSEYFLNCTNIVPSGNCFMHILNQGERCVPCCRIPDCGGRFRTCLSSPVVTP